MNRLNYKQAFDLITEAYIKDEIQPYCRAFCFCGTLGNIRNSRGYIDWDFSLYSFIEYKIMERALLSTLREETLGTGENIYGSNIMEDGRMSRFHIQEHPNYENALFDGMVKALEVLREIHLQRGDSTADLSVTAFKKRELCKS